MICHGERGRTGRWHPTAPRFESNATFQPGSTSAANQPAGSRQAVMARRRSHDTLD